MVHILTNIRVFLMPSFTLGSGICSRTFWLFLVKVLDQFTLFVDQPSHCFCSRVLRTSSLNPLRNTPTVCIVEFSEPTRWIRWGTPRLSSAVEVSELARWFRWGIPRLSFIVEVFEPARWIRWGTPRLTYIVAFSEQARWIRWGTPRLSFIVEVFKSASPVGLQSAEKIF